MKNSISSYENTFIIDGHKLPAVQSVDMSYQLPQITTKVLGEGHAKNTVTGPPQASLSISRVMTHKDPLVQYTGDISTNSSLSWKDKAFRFDDLYLDSYEASFQVNSMPTVNAQFTSFKADAGAGNKLTVLEPELEIQPITRKQIEIQCSGHQYNRVMSANFSANVNREVIHTFSQENPVQVLSLIHI